MRRRKEERVFEFLETMKADITVVMYKVVLPT